MRRGSNWPGWKPSVNFSLLGPLIALQLGELDLVELERNQRTKQGEIDAARIELAGLEAERRQAVIRAPRGGVVITGDVKVGDLLEPGKAVAEVDPRRINFSLLG